jgi:hypothetical protein
MYMVINEGSIRFKLGVITYEIRVFMFLIRREPLIIQGTIKDIQKYKII